MAITYTKKDNATLIVTKPASAVDPTVNEYKIEFLKQQEVAILKSKNDFVEARDKEIAEVRELLAQAALLGIKEEVVVQLEAETIRE